MIRDLLFRLRWWYRIKRGRCPMGPPPACPEFEEFEIRGYYTCVTGAVATVECTGIAASWCPIHGDCTCGEREPTAGRPLELNSPDCPLHSPDSDHAETEPE